MTGRAFLRTELPFEMKQPARSTHTAFTRLPVVDMSPLYSEDLSDRQQAPSVLDRAARDAGFLYLQGHGIPRRLIDGLEDATRTYFAQSLDAKMANYIGLSQNHSGYVPQGEEQFYGGSVDLKEAYDIGAESSSLMTRFVHQAGNQWPDLPGFQEAVAAYYQAMLELSRTLFRGFALALALPEHAFSQHLSQPPSQLRLLHYFENPDAEAETSGIAAHTDYEFFTILLPTAPGLQVLNGANEWIDVPLLQDCFVMNIGDMMEVVSGGRYMATTHRVRQVSQERYAFPFFCSLDYHTEVRPLIPPGEPYRTNADEPITCGDHLLAQTMQTFHYLKQKQAQGEIALPENARRLQSFGTAATRDT